MPATGPRTISRGWQPGWESAGVAWRDPQELAGAHQPAGRSQILGSGPHTSPAIGSLDPAAPPIVPIGVGLGTYWGARGEAFPPRAAMVRPALDSARAGPAESSPRRHRGRPDGTAFTFAKPMVGTPGCMHYL